MGQVGQWNCWGILSPRDIEGSLRLGRFTLLAFAGLFLCLLETWLALWASGEKPEHPWSMDETHDFPVILDGKKYIVIYSYMLYIYIIHIWYDRMEHVLHFTWKIKDVVPRKLDLLENYSYAAPWSGGAMTVLAFQWAMTDVAGFMIWYLSRLGHIRYVYFVYPNHIEELYIYIYTYLYHDLSW